MSTIVRFGSAASCAACVLFLASLAPLFAAAPTCDSCAGCSLLLNGEAPVVELRDNIRLDGDGTCVAFTGPNVTLDCKGYEIAGRDAGIGILNERQNGVVIRNCTIYRFDYGIVLDNVLDNTLLANSSTQNTVAGIRLDHADGCLLESNVANNNRDGIHLWNSNSNVLRYNEACANIEYDIVVEYGAANGGERNTCDDTEGWSEAGTSSGCLFSCGACDDWDLDGVCDDEDNCRFVDNPNQADVDNDGHGDVCDNCLMVMNQLQNDADLDCASFSTPYVSDPVCGDACDNCRDEQNPGQADSDGDCGSIPTPYSADPQCGDKCDNCPALANPDQSNQDFDFHGDVCDNCPTAHNSGQENGDSDSYGDACDNCPGLTNQNQADADSDGIGNACDNCPTTHGQDQTDWDGDGLGDICDDCPTVYDPDQPDWDGDQEGDWCDCDDGYMGPTENGADCGGQCAQDCEQKYDVSLDGTTYESKCMPALYQGLSTDRMNVVFMIAQDYNANWTQFREDIRGIIFDSYEANALIGGDFHKFNFWYVFDNWPWSVTLLPAPPGEEPECDWNEYRGYPTVNWKAYCPQGSVGAILHVNACRDSSIGDTFTAEGVSIGTFLHESGHSLFGLADEYDDWPNGCSTKYWEPSPHPNIFAIKTGCQAGTANTLPCTKFTNCKGDWWKAQPVNTIMNGCDATTPQYPLRICPFGADGEPRVNHVLDQYGSASASVYGPANETSKAVILTLRYDGESITPLSAFVRYGATPKRVLSWDGLRVDVVDAYDEVLDSFTIRDPLYRDYDWPLGAAYEEQVDFSVVVPVVNQIKTLAVYEATTGEPVAAVDVSALVVEFCVEHPTDPQCSVYDPDLDGELGPDDNCPLHVNPGQEDVDDDGAGDPCDNCAGLYNPGQVDRDEDGLGNACDPCTDADRDGFGLPGSAECPAGQMEDCDDGFASTWPEAPESNDGVDNQCYPDDPGHGVIDEISGLGGFHGPGNSALICWPAQTGAAEYQVARSLDPTLATSCLAEYVEDPCFEHFALPPVGGVVYYLARPVSPHVGSWGQNANGDERRGICSG